MLFLLTINYVHPSNNTTSPSHYFLRIHKCTRVSTHSVYYVLSLDRTTLSLVCPMSAATQHSTFYIYYALQSAPCTVAVWQCCELALIPISMILAPKTSNFSQILPYLSFSAHPVHTLCSFDERFLLYTCSTSLPHSSSALVFVLQLVSFFATFWGQKLQAGEC